MPHWFRAALVVGLAATASPAFGQQDNAMLQSFEHSAEMGDVHAQLMLGMAYQDGALPGVPEDQVKAAYWFRKAAEQGNANGEYALGHAYEEGKGVPADFDQAIVWMRKGVSGDPRARGELRKLFYRGRIDPVVDDQADNWWRALAAQAVAERKSMAADRTAAEAGDVVGLEQLGLDYLSGIGVAKDRTQAEAWLGKAAAKGAREADCIVAALKAYDTAMDVPATAADAATACEMAAQAGSAQAQRLLASLYLSGEGVSKSAENAFAWNRRAAEQGNSAAEYQVGLAYAIGYGVDEDRAQAGSWFKKASDQGNAGGTSILAMSLMFGPFPGDHLDFAASKALVDRGAEEAAEHERDLLYNVSDSAAYRAKPKPPSDERVELMQKLFPRIRRPSPQ